MVKSNLFSSLFENIDGLQVIKSFRLEGSFMRRQSPKIKSILDIQRKVRYVNLVNSGVINFIIIIAGLLIIVFLSKSSIVSRSITIGQIITFLALSRQVFSSMSSILDENLELQENGIILNRYFDFNQLATVELTNKADKIRTFKMDSIEFKHVGFHYIPQKPVFTDLNVLINRGDKILLDGGNGAGKSTFCKVLSLLYAPNSGDILVNGEKMNFFHESSLRKKILLVSNEDILFNDTIGYNLTFDYNSDPTVLLDMAKKVGLYDFIVDRPEGLDFIVNEKGANLSTGQRKKILLMRALLSNAELIIFDEILSGIDKESKERIEHYLNEDFQRSFIFISHEPLGILRFTKTLLMQHGSVKQLQLQGI